MSKLLFATAFCLALAGCAKSAGEQCLDSFRSSLKDPDSGRVIGFTDGTLTYTATNSYGARIQAKAICAKSDNQWSRDRIKEELMVLEQTTKVLSAFNECRRGGGSSESCAGSSVALRVNADVGELKKETARTLGFD